MNVNWDDDGVQVFAFLYLEGGLRLVESDPRVRKMRSPVALCVDSGIDMMAFRLFLSPFFLPFNQLL